MQIISLNSNMFKSKARQLFSINFMKSFTYCLIIIIILTLSACKFQVRYPSEFPSKTVMLDEEYFWFWGLVGNKKYELNDLCLQGRVYEISIDSTWKQKTYTILTLGIFSPRTITIVCSIRGE